jgi:signal peptide peptidase SppA
MAMAHGGKWGLQSSPEAMWFSFGPPVKETEIDRGVAQVFVRGPLEHHDEGCGDSYEALLCRVQAALTSEAQAVALRIDSPGGVVSGLNQCVAGIRAAQKAARKPLVAYVDEMATSAAYAIACGCSEIVNPPSGILGSVGVISTMVSYAAAAEAAGVQCVVITSGARKADGHPQVPIADAAQKAEKRKVDQLAMQFFQLASKSRGVSVEDLRGLEAGLFLGSAAVRAGLADAILGWRGLLDLLTSR